jgi:hypothetical protein
MRTEEMPLPRCCWRRSYVNELQNTVYGRQTPICISKMPLIVGLSLRLRPNNANAILHLHSAPHFVNFLSNREGKRVRHFASEERGDAKIDLLSPEMHLASGGARRAWRGGGAPVGVERGGGASAGVEHRTAEGLLTRTPTSRPRMASLSASTPAASPESGQPWRRGGGWGHPCRAAALEEDEATRTCRSFCTRPSLFSICRSAREEIRRRRDPAAPFLPGCGAVLPFSSDGGPPSLSAEEARHRHGLVLDSWAASDGAAASTSFVGPPSLSWGLDAGRGGGGPRAWASMELLSHRGRRRRQARSARCKCKCSVPVGAGGLRRQRKIL